MERADRLGSMERVRPDGFLIILAVEKTGRES